ncbi:MAG: ABC transporter permease, partial [Fibrobacteria bacterium]|nr:ABC transporter permease [Fibrobacteria bacterium]
DLSVGANMYLSGVVAGMLIENAGMPAWAALFVCLAIGGIIGACNAFFIVKLRALAFVVTLSMMITLRGIGMYITRSIPINFPESVTMMATIKVLGFIPLPVFIFGMVVLIAWLFLERTQSGKQTYAVGYNDKVARTAGIKTGAILTNSYIICGMCAGLAGFISIAQLGILNAGFGEGEEFNAIAAAVLGGTSLFGGIGSIFPGTVLGTIMIQMVQAGLVFVNIDLYIQPLVMATVIFLVVYIDSLRNRQIKKLARRNIIKETES